MNDAISRSALMERVQRKECEVAQERYIEGFNDAILRIRSMIHSAPAINAVPVERLGEFGRLFMDYKGCPRGAVGRSCVRIEEEVLQMKPITDVDGGRWIPVNADALHELVRKYTSLVNAELDAVPVVHARWIEKQDGWVECSNCGEEYLDEYNMTEVIHYCPNCGARMDGEEEG